MSDRRKICVVTGTRADFGLLSSLMHLIKDDPGLELQIVATGMHLSPEFGLTYRSIEAEGFRIDEKVEMLLSADTPVAIAKSIGIGTIGFADTFNRLGPELLVLLGDRFEILAAAQAALVALIPIAHIHGGETTRGAFDEAIRHSVTKMSHLHFPTTEVYRRRIIQLGENPKRVFLAGAPGLDHIRNMSFLDRRELEESLEFDLGDGFFLVTFHPVTLAARPDKAALDEMLAALDQFPDYQLLITYPNADTAGRRLIDRLNEYAASRLDRVCLTKSLGQQHYLSAAKQAAVIIGNSSSGIIEAPSLGTPSVNIGERQAGRIAAQSVIQCKEEKGDIEQAVLKALHPDMKALLAAVKNPYGDGKTASRIFKELKSADLADIVMKHFYDLRYEA